MRDLDCIQVSNMCVIGMVV